MANEDIQETEASPDVTTSQVSSTSVTPPEPLSVTDMEKVTTAGAAATAEAGAAAAVEAEADSVAQIISQMPTSTSQTEEEDDIIDESMLERIAALSEMFPVSVRGATGKLGSKSLKFLSGTYWVARHVMWFATTTSLLLFAPILFETERVNTQEMIKQDRNKLVLGPGTAMSGGPPSSLGAK